MFTVCNLQHGPEKREVRCGRVSLEFGTLLIIVFAVQYPLLVLFAQFFGKFLKTATATHELFEVQQRCTPFATLLFADLLKVADSVFPFSCLVNESIRFSGKQHHSFALDDFGHLYHTLVMLAFESGFRIGEHFQLECFPSDRLIRAWVPDWRVILEI